MLVSLAGRAGSPCLFRLAAAASGELARSADEVLLLGMETTRWSGSCLPLAGLDRAAGPPACLQTLRRRER